MQPLLWQGVWHTHTRCDMREFKDESEVWKWSVTCFTLSHGQNLFSCFSTGINFHPLDRFLFLNHVGKTANVYQKNSNLRFSHPPLPAIISFYSFIRHMYLTSKKRECEPMKRIKCGDRLFIRNMVKNRLYQKWCRTLKKKTIWSNIM